VFTPATKGEQVEQDEANDVATVVAAVGAERAEQVRELSRALYRRGAEIALGAGSGLADAKVEVGVDASGVVLGDEVLTPDSSRFWPADQWQPGRAQPSYDKQFVRDWLLSEASGWDRHSGEEPPPLPEDVVEQTRAKYVEAYERLTGRTFR